MKLTKSNINQVAEILTQTDNIALFSHTRPDGDTLGASVALYFALKKQGKCVDVYCDSAVDGAFLKFNGMDVVKQKIHGDYDMLVSIDCGDLNRLGDFADYYYSHSNTMTIDHHCGEFFSRYNCLCHYASTCQMVYEVISAMGIELDKDIATCLYIGLCTDTGSFANSNTDKASFDMASNLIEYGVAVDVINRTFFKEISYSKTKLVGTVLARTRLYCDDKVALIYADKPDLDSLGLTIADTDGLVQHAFNVNCAEVGVCLSYYADNVYKVSMRSKGANIRQVCNHFGGGGHLVASGCMISGYLEDVIDKIVKALGDYLW